MADLTVEILDKVIHQLPRNCKLMIRHLHDGGFVTVEVGLIAYTANNELIFLAEPDV